MKYNPDIHHRRSIRLRGYDYSREGAYFITICTQHRRCIFGHIENGEMILNEFGQMAYAEWEKLPRRWPHVELGAFQIMPNHTHGVIIIHDTIVGAPLAGALADAQNDADDHTADAQNDADDHTAGAQNDADDTTTTRAPARGAPTAWLTQIQWAEKPTVGQIVGAYKSCTLTGCLKIAKSQQPEMILGKLWQRNYWENIIRDVEAFDRISNYIINNPANWRNDKFFNQE